MAHRLQRHQKRLGGEILIRRKPDSFPACAQGFKGDQRVEDRNRLKPETTVLKQ